MSRPTLLTIDLNALQHNFNQVKTLSKAPFIIAMIKANAYGHGLISVGKVLKADALGVASFDEAMQLREAGIMTPIILMEGLFSFNEINEASRKNFSLVVHHEAHLSMLEKANLNHPFFVWLKINTGMHRLGIDPHQFKTIYERLMQCQNVIKPIGLMTHFSEADHLEHQTTFEQLALFERLTKDLKGPKSLANSAAILGFPQTHGDWIRPGLMLYGASPFPEHTGCDHRLKPVMTLSSQIIAKTHVSKGGKIGYGGRWEAPADMNIGIVGVGYGDGYPQFAEDCTPVLVKQTICPLVGRVSMDMLAVDLRNMPHANIGDPVVLWGQGLPVECIAKHSHTSPYEILTRMTPRSKIEIKTSTCVSV